MLAVSASSCASELITVIDMGGEMAGAILESVESESGVVADVHLLSPRLASTSGKARQLDDDGAFHQVEHVFTRKPPLQ